MKRKLKCYMAYTTLLYRILGVVLIPCAFWVLCVFLLWKYDGFRTEMQSGNGVLYGLYFSLSVYIVLYEIFTDHWVLGGCLSDAGKGLGYFRTSHRGVEVMRNIVSTDLMRRFLYSMVFSGIFFLFTGWKASIVLGLSMYCVIAGVLNGSRHVDGMQLNTAIAILAQIGMTLVNILNVFLIDVAGNGEAIMLVMLAIVYCAVALGVSRLTVRRVITRIRGKE